MNVATSHTAARVGVRELKNQLSAHLSEVKAGREVVVTERGKPIARLMPVDAGTDRMVDLIEAGIVRPPQSGQRRLPEQRAVLTNGSTMDDDISAQRP